MCYDALKKVLRSKQIGIETGKDMNRFIRDERHPGESTLDTLRRYVCSDECHHKDGYKKE